MSYGGWIDNGNLEKEEWQKQSKTDYAKRGVTCSKRCIWEIDFAVTFWLGKGKFTNAAGRKCFSNQKMRQ